MKRSETIIMLSTLIIFVSLTACAVISTIPIEHDRFFDSYINEYKMLTKLDTSNIRIKFVENFDSGTTAGMCTYYKKHPELNYIRVSRTFWKNADKLTKKALLFHELTHCVGLYYGHDNRYKISNYCPTSIMNSWIPDIGCLDYYWKDYMKDIQTKSKRRR